MLHGYGHSRIMLLYVVYHLKILQKKMLAELKEMDICFSVVFQDRVYVVKIN